MPDVYSLLRYHEGVRYVSYPDSRGNPTIGIGHKLTTPLTDTAVNQILHDDVNHTLVELQRLTWFQKLDNVRAMAIVDMAFDMGVEGVLGFEAMIRAIAHENWVGAHDEVINSKWITEVGKRASDVATMLLTGLWPGNLK